MGKNNWEDNLRNLMMWHLNQDSHVADMLMEVVVNQVKAGQLQILKELMEEVESKYEHNNSAVFAKVDSIRDLINQRLKSLEGK